MKPKTFPIVTRRRSQQTKSTAAPDVEAIKISLEKLHWQSVIDALGDLEQAYRPHKAMGQKIEDLRREVRERFSNVRAPEETFIVEGERYAITFGMRTLKYVPDVTAVEAIQQKLPPAEFLALVAAHIPPSVVEQVLGASAVKRERIGPRDVTVTLRGGIN